MRIRLTLIAGLPLITAQLAFASPSDGEVFWTLGFFEGLRVQKQVCEEKYLEFKDKNEIAFRASPYSQATGEEIINSMAKDDQKQKLLAYLPKLRTDAREKFMGMRPEVLKGMCADYAVTIEKFAQNAVAKKKKLNANENFLVSCPINAGDSLSKVKKFFQITEEPKQAERPILGGFRYSYHFPAYGIYIFFDSAKLVQTLRFDSPFVGKIEGISIGDSKEKILRLKGEPVKRFDGFPDTDSLESRKKRKTEIIENLPDPSSKELVRKAFAQIVEIDHLPFPYTEAWLYKSNERALLRYDFSSSSGKVVTVLSDKGTTETSATNEPSSILEVN